jgi:hypothetical protein
MPLLPSAKGETNENPLVITNQRAGEHAHTRTHIHTFRKQVQFVQVFTQVMTAMHCRLQLFN